MSSNFVCVCVCVYKMVEISRKQYKKCEVEIIDKERCFWANRKDLEVELDVTNWAQIQKKKNTDKN